MTNEVSTNVFGGAVGMTSSADLASTMQESAQKDPRGGAGDSDFLNFSGKKGTYSIGADSRAIAPDEWWVVNIGSFEDGFICWKGGKPIHTRLANISDPTIPTPDSEEGGPFDGGNGEGWFQAKGMTLKSLDTDDQGYFKINSISGVSAFADLQKMIGERAARGEAAWPVLGLDAEEFTAGGYKNSKPKFIIEGWLSDTHVSTALLDPAADVEALMAESVGSTPQGKSEEVADEEKPKRKARGATKEEAPKKRRRSL